MANPNNPRKLFTIEVNAECNCVQVGVVTLECIAYLYWDGTVRTVDINQAKFGGNDVAGYVSACLPDTWDSWIEQAETYIKDQLEEPAPVEHADDSTGEGYLQTNL